MAVLCLISKDLRILVGDRRALTILFAMPLVIVAILGASTGQLLGWKSQNAMLDLVLILQSDSPLVTEIVAALSEQDGVDLLRCDDDSTARCLVDEGDRLAVVTFGPAFGTRVGELSLTDVLDPEGGKLAEGLTALDVHIYTRPVQSVAGALTEQMIFAETMRVVLPHLARRNPVLRTMIEIQDQEPPWAAEPAAIPGPEPAAQSSSIIYETLVPAYTVLFAFFILNIMANSFIEEKNRGTLKRLRAAPVRTSQLVLGKTVPFYMISVVQGVLLFVCGKLLFGMSFGNAPWLLLPVVLCTSLAATGLGLLTAVMVRTEAQVSAYANMLIIALGGVSGCFMPRDWLPEIMQRISLAVPHAWALMAYDQLLYNPAPDATRILGLCAVLIAFAGTFFALGCCLFGRLLRQP